ncbi:MAG: HAMP domain-containing protein [Calditrichaeota bacterium]|nr:HAMP domain-containing protein [Calditrichota bacterium]
MSIRWKISGILIISNLILGFIIVVLVSSTVSKSLEKELIERGKTIGMNLALNCSDLILENDRLGLRHLITSNISFESLDYILILDSDGNIVGDTFNGQVPEVLRVENSDQLTGKTKVRVLTVPELENEYYDIWVPVEEGFIGYVRVGMNRGYVQDTVNGTIRIIVLTILGVTLIGIVVVILLAGRLIQPIIYLTKRADEISQGKLEQVVEVRTNDEIEQLAAALERLRESIKIALERLKKQQSIRM